MTLKEALTSEASSAMVQKISEAEHLPDEKIHEVGRAVSNVLFGFIHPEDVPVELKLSGLNPQTVSVLVDSINKTIFAPIRGDIDKAYQPIIKSDVAPKVLQDIGPSLPTKPAPGAAPAPVSINKINSVPPTATPKPTTTPAPTASAAGWSTGKTFTAPNSISSTPTPIVKPSAPPSQPIAASAIKPSAPVIKPVVPQVPPPVPAKPAAPSFASTPSPSAPNNPFGGKFEPMPRAASAAPAAPTAPAPFILHEDTRPTSLQSSSDFRLSRPNEKGNVDMAMFQQKAAPRPAVLELGNIPAPNRPTTPPTNQNIPPRYPATQSSGPRSVSEITAPPSPSSGPKPPMPPTPPKPGDPPRVIRQNY